MREVTELREPKWYALFVATGKEYEIYNQLQNLDIESLMPRRKLRERRNGEFKEVERLLFPSYLFIKIQPKSFAIYQLLKGINGLIRILGDKSGPLPITEEEVMHILLLAEGGKALEISTGYKEGEMVKIISGPLQGIEGSIVKIDARRHRAKVRLQLLGQSREIELGIDVFEDNTNPL